MSYGCELYAGQLRAGDDYLALRPVFSICLLDGVLWDDSPKVHHAFRLSDRESGRSLERTLEIHTLELGKYNLSERDMATASPLDQWLYWLRHAQEYEAADLLRLFPQAPIIQATRTLDAIAAITEDKTMYDSREKARRDQQWALHASRLEGEEKGKLEGKHELIRTLQAILREPISGDEELAGQSLEELQKLAAQLQARRRPPRAAPATLIESAHEPRRSISLIESRVKLGSLFRPASARVAQRPREAWEGPRGPLSTF